MADTFELEQAIMNCWHVVDDIKTVANNATKLSQDDLLNALIGMSTLYQMKFDHLFGEFERYVSDGEKSTDKWQAVWCPGQIDPKWPAEL